MGSLHPIMFVEMITSDGVTVLININEISAIADKGMEIWVYSNGTMFEFDSSNMNLLRSAGMEVYVDGI